MPFRSLLLFLLIVQSAWCAYAGEIVAPGTFGKIQNAIDAAQSGDTVIIAPGEYTENLKLKNGVSLTAKESGKSIIHAAIPTAPALQIDDCLYNTITGIVFTGPADTVCVVNKSIVTFQQCTFSGGTDGILLANGGWSTIRDCMATDNKRIGIFVRGSMSTPMVERCTSTRNGFAGIFVAERGRGSYEANTCSENGIGLILNRASDVFTKGNILCKNRSIGSYVSHTCTFGKGSDRKHFSENGDFCSQELATLFDEKNFDKLESIANRLRDSHEKTILGKSELEEFYSLTANCRHFNKTTETELMEDLKTWETKYPQSITRRVLLASAYREFSKREKNDKEPETNDRSVYLSKAWAVFEETQKLNPKDPELYLVGMKICDDDPTKIISSGSVFYDAIKRLKFIANGGMDHPVSEQWFNAGIQCDPDYFPLYARRVNYELYTSTEIFAKKVSDARKGDDGDILYAEIAAELFEENDFGESIKNSNFDWERIKRGINAFLKRYPDSWLKRHLFCRLACSYKDREMAATLFAGCFENSAGHPWVNQYQFDVWKKWAVEKGPEPFVSSVHDDAKYGNIDEVRSYLDKGGDINQLDDTGYSLLTLAVWNKEDSVARLLIDRGCDVNKGLCNQILPLTLAISYENEEIVNALLDHKPDVNLSTAEGFTPFMIAIDKKNEALSKKLLEMGSDPNRAMPFGSTPLARALKNKMNDLAKILIERGADVNAHGPDGEIPLLFAAAQGDPDLCNLLFAHGADPKGKTRKGRAPLGAAARSGNLDVVKLMMEKGCDPPEYRSADGWSILHSAVDGKSKEVVAFLLERIPVTAMDYVPTTEYRPILHHAVKGGNVEIVQLFLDKKPNLNLRDKDGNTPLAIAIADKNEPMIALLRSQGATE